MKAAQVNQPTRKLDKWVEDGPKAFGRFYAEVFGRECPRHAMEEWIKPLYAARGLDKGLVIEAFRGSSKTTTVTIGWLAFQIGLKPHKSYMLVQVGDELAKDTVQEIADLIEYNPGWQRVFPDVAADRKAGWSTRGYEVKRVDMDYEDWRQLCANEKGKDPSLVGMGYKSRAIIGRHPTGALILDDIHDENNTRSGRELATVIKIVQGTILPTVTPDTWKVAVGTPWRRDDVLAYLKGTGEFESVKTPAIRVKEAGSRDKELGLGEGSKGAMGAGEQGDKRKTKKKCKESKVPQNFEESIWKATWFEGLPLKDVEKQRRVLGEVEFARMYLLDLEAASGVHLRSGWLQRYPYEEIGKDWPVVMGVDYASVADQLKASTRDYFAVAIGRGIPGGGVVLVDGFRGKVSQGQAQQKLQSIARQYPTLQTIGVEAVGKGEEFFHLMLRTSWLPVTPMQPGRKSKGYRFEKVLAPMFEYGRVKVSSAETPFLQAFRDEWVRWPYGEHDDTLDAVYWMLQVAKHHMVVEEEGESQKREKVNPFAELGRG